MHETVGGWRIPDKDKDEKFQEDFLNSIQTDGTNSVINNLIKHFISQQTAM